MKVHSNLHDDNQRLVHVLRILKHGCHVRLPRCTPLINRQHHRIPDYHKGQMTQYYSKKTNLELRPPLGADHQS